MKRLFLRELRRMALPSAAMFALGVVSLFFYYGVLSLLGGGPRVEFVDMALWVVACGTPWLLGAIAFAPDHESGAEFFLAALPVGRLRLFALRTGAALAWSIAVILCFALVFELVNQFVFGRSHGRFKLATHAATWALGGAAFLAAAVAATTTRKTLVGFVTAPLFAVAPLYLGGVVLHQLGAPGEYALAGLIGIFPLLALAAGLVYVRTGVRRDGQAGLRMGLGVLGAGVLLASGVTSAGFALDRIRDDGTPFVSLAHSQSHETAIAESRRQSDWRLERYLEGFRHVVLNADAPELAWHLPHDVKGVAVSPSGRRVLVLNHERGILGLATPKTRALEWGISVPRGLADSAALAPTGSFSTGVALWNSFRHWAGVTQDPRTVAWVDETPYLLFRGAQAYTAWDGSLTRRLPEGARVESTAGALVIAVDEGGARKVLDLRSGDVHELTGIPADASLKLSANGQWIFASDTTCLGSLFVRRLNGAGDLRRVLSLKQAPPADLEPESLSFSGLQIDLAPGEQFALLRWAANGRVRTRTFFELRSSAALLNLASGVVSPLRRNGELGWVEPDAVPVYWSPDGSRVYFEDAWAEVRDAPEGLPLTSVDLGEPVVRLDERRVLQWEGVFDLQTGRNDLQAAGLNLDR